jgi:phenylpropionate dioxygenase-like ring-hydroxylating dioxygenase large terminal subunit
LLKPVQPRLCRCAYHGWSFGGDGKCASIPQLGDPKARDTACRNSRTSVPSYPTAVEDGLLFAWLEAGPGGAAAAAADLDAKGGRLVVDEVAGGAAKTVWASHEVPNDYLYWAEQGVWVPEY